MSRATATYRVPLRQKGILTVPKEIRDVVGDDAIFQWDVMDDGSIRVTPLGTHSLVDAWFYKPEWLEKERAASDTAARGEGRTFANAQEALSDLENR